MNKVLTRNLKFFLLTIGLTVLGILVKPGVASAAIPPGSPNNAIPNNSVWEAGPRSQPANLVVALGGMAAPETDLLLYFPWYGDPNDPDQFTRLTIEGACDTDLNDVGGTRANTTYFLQNISVFNVVVGTANVIQNDGNFVVFQCVPSGGSTLVIDIKHDPNDSFIRTFNVAGDAKDFKAALMWAIAEEYVGSGDYENQFRVLSSNPNVYLTFAAEDVTGSDFRTGIYNRTSDLSGCPSQSSSASCYWATSIAFAPPCWWNSGNGARIAFYDNDAQAGGYQEGPHNIRWSIYRFPRDGSGGAQFVTSGNLAGGNNVQEDVGIPTDPAYSYEIRLDHIYVRNSIQVLLPWQQMEVLSACFAKPKGVIDNVVCSKIYGWAFDPDTPDQSIQVHIYLDGPAGSSPYPPSGFLADQPSGNAAFDPPDPRADVNGTFKINGNHRFDVPFTALNAQQQAALNGGGSHTFYVYAIDTGGRTNPHIGTRSFDMNTCIPPATFSCSTISTNPSPVEAGAQFSLSINVSTSGGAPPSYPYTATLNVPGPPTNPGTMSPHSPVVGNLPKDSNQDIDFNGLTVSTAGHYQGDVTIDLTSGGGPNLVCPFNQNAPPCASSGCSFLAVNKPYFTVRGGDVATGIVSCAGWSGGTGTLTAWNNGLSPGNLGAGTNLAAYALNAIDGFVSKNAQSSLKSLTFANTGSSPPANSAYGGGLTTGAACPNKYYDNPASPLAGGSTIAGRTVAVANRTAVYVNGNAYISGNITYDAGATTVNDLPSFWLVANGDIFIDPSVTQLDGVYVAQGGKIYTCSNGFAPPTQPQLNSSGAAGCQRQLIVNGAFIANEIKLYRSNGSMSNGIPAEIFYYTPGTWLVAPCEIIGCGSTSSTPGYDSITSLPPVL